jgi:uncharacterized protein (TIGR02118 family)
MPSLNVLYPQPTDQNTFETDYAEHLKMLHDKMGIPADARPYTVTKFVDGPAGPAAYYQMFSMPFESVEAIGEAMSSPQMQEVAADANRISSGGHPVILIGG